MNLRAHHAANRFALRFAARRNQTRSMWSSCALRWRLPRRAAQVQGGRGASTSIFQSWFSQFHLHFATAVKANEARRSAVSSLRNVTISQRLLERQAVARVVLPYASVQSAPKLSLRPRRHQDVIMREHVSRQVQHLSTVSRLAFCRTERAAVSNFEFRKSVHLRSTVRHAVSHTGDVRRSGRHHEFIKAPAFQQLRRAAHPRPEPAGRFSSPYPVRTAELVWRKPEKTNTGSESEHAVGSFSHVSGSSPRVSLSNPPQQTARQVPPAAEMRAMVLDSATIDRLADDVIRRVERHIRIERERRGV